MLAVGGAFTGRRRAAPALAGARRLAQPAQVRAPGVLGAAHAAPVEAVGEQRGRRPRASPATTARSPSSRASRSNTVPPSSSASAAPGGNAGAPPSRSRRRTAGRTWRVCPDSHCAAPSSSHAPRIQRRSRSGAERRRAAAGVARDVAAGEQRATARASASRASPRRSRRAGRAAAGRARAARARPPSRPRSGGGRRVSRRCSGSQGCAASSWAGEPCSTTASSPICTSSALTPRASAARERVRGWLARASDGRVGLVDAARPGTWSTGRRSQVEPPTRAVGAVGPRQAVGQRVHAVTSPGSWPTAGTATWHGRGECGGVRRRP